MPKKNILIRSRLRRAQSLLEAGKFVEAESLLSQLVRQQRMNAQSWFLLGAAYGLQGKPRDAESAFRKVVKIDAAHAEGHYNLGIALRDQGRYKEALASFRRALDHKPEHVDARDNLAHVLLHLGRFDAAIEVFRDILRRHPGRAEIHVNLGTAAQAAGRLSEAVESYRRALEIKPDLDGAQESLGSALAAQGRFEEALDCYRTLLQRQPHNARAGSNYLLTLNYLDDIAPEALFDAHREWGERFVQADSQGSYVVPTPRGKRLRIGFVSSDFRRHSVAFFLEPLLEALDRERFEVFCYASLPNPDEVTARLRSLADGWRDILNLSDAEAARRIREDGIDILVDLNGHTGGNRLGLFARRAAPAQVTWLGYPNTTGLPTMDYRIVDTYTDPPGQEALHTETLLRMPGCFLCYRPLPEAPEVSPPPVHENGHVTFGSFNNLAKISTGVIRCWSALLRTVPDARLLLKNPSLTDHSTRERYHAAFEQEGIERNRIELIGHTPGQVEHLARYARIDIALDTFPYNGTTTTCEALWMGVPVITMAGDRHAARVGLSLLNAAGYPQWVANTPEEYVALAAGLAADRGRLAGLRAGLRESLRRSRLCDAKGFADHMLSVLGEATRASLSGMAGMCSAGVLGTDRVRRSINPATKNI